MVSHCCPCCLSLQGKGCGVWQHCDCLGLQQGGQKHFLCELCR